MFVFIGNKPITKNAVGFIVKCLQRKERVKYKLLVNNGIVLQKV